MYNANNRSGTNGICHVLIIISCISFAISTQSCSPTSQSNIVVESRQRTNRYYKVSMPNTQLLTNKNEAAGSISEDFADNLTQLNVGYMPADHIGLVASIVAGDPMQGSLKKYEFGVGYTTSLSPGWLFETYTGTGFGRYDNEHATGKSSVKFSSYFLQPTIIRSVNNNNLQLVFSSRFNRLQYRLRERTFDTSREPITLRLIEQFENKSHLFYEPAIAVRFGAKHFLFNLQLAKGVHLSEGDIDSGPVALTFGIVFRLNLQKKKKLD